MNSDSDKMASASWMNGEPSSEAVNPRELPLNPFFKTIVGAPVGAVDSGPVVNNPCQESGTYLDCSLLQGSCQGLTSNSWGIGGFATPTVNLMTQCYPSSTTASTLGNPQMPSVSYCNTRAQMGYGSRMASASAQPRVISYAMKRKQEDDIGEISSTKHHVTEEKMSAHLSSLHLSQMFRSHQLGTDEIVIEDENGDDCQHVNETNNVNDDQHLQLRLVISEEMKSIRPEGRQLPMSIITNLTRPRMELMLWRPPTCLLPPLSINNSVSITAVAESNKKDVGSNVHLRNGDLRCHLPVSPTSSIQCSEVTTAAHSTGAQSCSITDTTSASGRSIDHRRDSEPLLSLSQQTLSPSYQLQGAEGNRTPSPPLPLDLSDRMEFNNNTDGPMVPNFMWLEENNNMAMIDLNAMPVDADILLPPLPDDDDMDL